jgi:geranylgeranyl pyrophosphate synthase
VAITPQQLEEFIAASREELVAMLSNYLDVMTPELVRMGKFALSGPGKVLHLPETPPGTPYPALSAQDTPSWMLNVILACMAALPPERRGEWRVSLPGVVAVELSMAAADLLDELADDDPSPFVREFGPGQALNTGSLMLVMAQQALTPGPKFRVQSPESSSGDSRPGTLDSGLALKALGALQDMLVQAAVGQHLDMLYDKLGPDEVDLEMSGRMTDLKAGALVEGASRIGAILSGAEDRVVELVARFGKASGSIAQIINDVQDVIPLDKQAGMGDIPERKTDIRLRKRTLPIVFALREEGPQPNAVQRAFQGEEAVDEEELRRVIVATGAVNFANLIAEVHRQKALEALEELEALRQGARDLLLLLLPPEPASEG